MEGCQVHRDCEFGYSCGSDNVCSYVSTCANDTQCSVGHYCAATGFCYFNSDCTKDSDCAPGRYCDYVGSQKCVPVEYCNVDDPLSCIDQLLTEQVSDGEVKGLSCVQPALDCIVGGANFDDAYCNADSVCAVPHYCDGFICRRGGCSSQHECAPGLECDGQYEVCVRP